MIIEPATMCGTREPATLPAKVVPISLQPRNSLGETDALAEGRGIKPSVPLDGVGLSRGRRSAEEVEPGGLEKPWSPLRGPTVRIPALSS
jgi:hypothetical protein